MSEQEPVFNVSEKPVLHLIGTLAFFQCVAILPSVKLLLLSLFAVVPMQTESLSVIRQIVSLFGHGFLHMNFSHLLFGAFLVLIFGIIAYRGINELEHPRLSVALRFWLIFVLGTFFGGLMQWGWWTATKAPSGLLLGATAGGSAFFAAAGWAIGGRERVIVFGVIWAVLNIGMAMLASIFGQIYWVANIGGFVMGALLAPYWVKPSITGNSIFR